MRERGGRERFLHNDCETGCQSLGRHTLQWMEDEVWAVYGMAQRREKAA